MLKSIVVTASLLVLGLTSGLASSAATPPVQPPNDPAPAAERVILSDRGDRCPVPAPFENHKLAVTCQTPVEDLIHRLQSPAACGTSAKWPADDACAVILYTLDPALAGQFNLPPTMIVRVGRVTHPDNINDTLVTVIKSNGSSEVLPAGRVYELLIPIRIADRVRVYNSGAANGKRADQKQGLFSQQVRYYPAMFVGRGEASQVMSPAAVKTHFTMPVQVLQDLDKLLSPGCLIDKLHRGC